MKNLLIVLAVLGLNTSIAEAKTFRLKADWKQPQYEVDGMGAGDELTIYLPLQRGAEPAAEIVDRAQVLAEPGQEGDCVVQDVKINKERRTVEIKVQLGDLNWDDGFNGCVVEINRGLATDSGSDGQIQVSFGTFIED